MPRKSKSSPISFFSFQDIITSITGIMLVIVLLLVLQILDSKTTQASPEIAPQNHDRTTDVQNLKQQVRQQKKQLAEKQELFNKLNAQTADIVTHQPTETLAKLEVSLKQQLQDTLETNSQLEQTLNQTNTSIRQLKETIDQQKEKLGIKTEQQQLEHDLNVAKLTRDIKNAERILAQNQKLALEFAGNIQRTPILVECQKWGFKTKIHPDGKVNVFGKEENTKPALLELLLYLKSLDLKKHYVVMLVKPDFLPFYTETFETIKRLSPDVAIGKEPVSNQERCF